MLGHPGIGAGLETSEREQAHGFDAAGDDHAVAAGSDALIGYGNGFKTRGTEAVDGGAGNFNRQACAQDGPAGDVPSLLALGLGAAQDYVVDFGFTQAWNPVQSPAHGECGEIVGAGGRKGALGGGGGGGGRGGGPERGFGPSRGAPAPRPPREGGATAISNDRRAGTGVSRG